MKGMTIQFQACQSAWKAHSFRRSLYSSSFGNEKWIVEVSYISTKCSTYIKWDACKSLTGLNQGSYQNDSSS